MMQSGVFQQRPAKDECPYKFTCMDFLSDSQKNQTLFVGDLTGNLYKYPIRDDSNQLDDIIAANSKDTPYNLGTKKQVESLKVYPLTEQLFALAEGNLYYVNSSSLQTIQKIDLGGKCTNFCFNGNKEDRYQKQILIVQGKNASIYEFDIKSRQFILKGKQNGSFPAQPSTVAFLGSIVVVGFHNKGYITFNLEQNWAQEELLIKVPKDIKPFLKMVSEKGGENYLMALSINSLFISIDTNGTVLQKDTIDLSNCMINKKEQTVIVEASIIEPYLVILLENQIKVFNLMNCKEMSTIQFQSNLTGICMTITSNKLFYGTSAREILYLFLQPYDILISKYLEEGKIEEATQVFESNVSAHDPTRQKQKDQFDLDASWSLIRQLKFDEAKNLMQNTNFDPRELLLLFQEFHPQKAFYHTNLKRKSNDTITQIINRSLEKKTANNASMTKDQLIEQNKANNMKYKRQAEQFMLALFEKRRKDYIYDLSKKNKNKEQLTFQISKNSISLAPGSAFEPTTIEDLLELIDFVMLKIYFKLDLSVQLKDFLQQKSDGKSNQIYCKNLYSELLPSEKDINTMRNGQHQVLAIFYENFDKFKESLEIWKQVGTSSQNSQFIKEACEETIGILIKCCELNEKKLIQNYLLWVIKADIKADLQISCKLYMVLPESLISPDDMKRYFHEQVYSEEYNKDKANQVWEKYIEIIVLHKGIEEERYHSFLAMSYIDQLFRIYPKSTLIKDIDRDNIEIKNYQNKLNSFLESPTSRYNTNIVLEKIKDSWLLKNEIFLYKKEKRHDEALKKLVYDSQFKWAEAYCSDGEDMLLTKLFDIYIEFYNQCQQQLKIQSSSDLEKTKIGQTSSLFKRNINNMLKKYATHSQLDPLRVLEKIPDDWILTEQGGNDDDGPYLFLSSIISHTLHKKRSMKSAKHLSEMDLLNIECKLVEAKQAHIKISTDKKCAVCSKGISDKVFVVYPNGVTAHHQCITNKSICPVTLQDFERTFKG